ncbi:MAG: hypothetical protein U0670_01105 [Anaerolineae bacterium]
MSSTPSPTTPPTPPNSGGTNTPTPPPAPSPFASAGGSAGATAPPPPNAPAPSAPAPRPNPFGSPPSGLPRPSSPPGSLFSRLGARASFDYMAMNDTLVMFDLRDVAPVLFDQLNITPPVKEDGTPDKTDVKALITALEKNRPLLDELKLRLNTYWDDFQLTGAVHVYDWREEVKQAATNRLNAVKLAPHFMRATDPDFVLNVLARSRSYLLIHGAALALDRPFLERVVMTDDPRLLAAVKQTAFTEDSLVPPPPPTDDVFGDDDDDDDK